MGGLKPEDVEAWVAVTRRDLATGQLRVSNFCYTCPFCDPVDPPEKERSGNPKVKCSHPATYIPPDPLKVDIDSNGIIPPECPLRVRPTLVFLDPKEEFY